MSTHPIRDCPFSPSERSWCCKTSEIREQRPVSSQLVRKPSPAGICLSAFGTHSPFQSILECRQSEIAGGFSRLPTFEYRLERGIRATSGYFPIAWVDPDLARLRERLAGCSPSCRRPKGINTSTKHTMRNIKELGFSSRGCRFRAQLPVRRSHIPIRKTYRSFNCG